MFPCRMPPYSHAPTSPSNSPTAIQGVLPMCRWLGKLQSSSSMVHACAQHSATSLLHQTPNIWIGEGWALSGRVTDILLFSITLFLALFHSPAPRSCTLALVAKIPPLLIWSPRSFRFLSLASRASGVSLAVASVIGSPRALDDTGAPRQRTRPPSVARSIVP